MLCFTKFWNLIQYFRPIVINAFLMFCSTRSGFSARIEKNVSFSLNKQKTNKIFSFSSPCRLLLFCLSVSFDLPKKKEIVSASSRVSLIWILQLVGFCALWTVVCRWFVSFCFTSFVVDCVAHFSASIFSFLFFQISVHFQWVFNCQQNDWINEKNDIHLRELIWFEIEAAAYHSSRNTRPSRSTDAEVEEDLPSSPRELTYDARDVGGPSSGRQDYREMRDLRCDYRDPPHRDYHEYRDSRDQRDPRDARDMRDTYRERNEWDSEDRGPPARHHSRDSDYASPHRAPSRRPRNAVYDDRRWTPSSVDQANYFLKELEKTKKM